jgi:streptogramin lyase
MTVLIHTRRRTLFAASLAAVMISSTAVLGMVAPAQALDPMPGPISLWHDLPLAKAGGQAVTLSPDGDGNIWYIETTTDDLVRVDVSSHHQTAFDIGPTVRPRAIASASDGSMWFSDALGSEIGRLDPTTGTVLSFPLPFGTPIPGTMSFGSDGNLYFPDAAGVGLAQMTTAGVVTTVPIVGGPIGSVASTPDGRIWFTQETPDHVGSYDPLLGRAFDSGITAPVNNRLTVSKSGDVWVDGFDEALDVAVFSKISPSGVITSYPVDGSAANEVYPTAIVGGASDDVYFVDQSYGYGTLSSSGDVHFARLDGYHLSMAVDGAGHVWINTPWGDNLTWY